VLATVAVCDCGRGGGGGGGGLIKRTDSRWIIVGE